MFIGIRRTLGCRVGMLFCLLGLAAVSAYSNGCQGLPCLRLGSQVGGVDKSSISSRMKMRRRVGAVRATRWYAGEITEAEELTGRFKSRRPLGFCKVVLPRKICWAIAPHVVETSVSSGVVWPMPAFYNRCVLVG